MGFLKKNKNGIKFEINSVKKKTHWKATPKKWVKCKKGYLALSKKIELDHSKKKELTLRKTEIEYAETGTLFLKSLLIIGTEKGDRTQV